MDRLINFFKPLQLADNPAGYDKEVRHRAKLCLFAPIIAFFLFLFILFVLVWIGNFAADKQIAFLYNIIWALVISLNYLLVGLTVFGMFSLPAGIILWFKKPLGKIDINSGKGKASSLPKELKGWNWGAAGWPVVWGLANFSYQGLLSMIPVVNFFWWIYMGKMGNRLAWQSNRWESPSQLLEWQKKWRAAGIVGVILKFLGAIVLLLDFLVYIGG